MYRHQRWGRGLLVVLAMGLLVGCGFHLRNSQEFTFDTIALSPAPGSAIALDLIRYLGDKVVPAVSQSNSPAAQVILDIVQEQREKTVVAVNASGQVREMQLQIRLKFRVRTPQGDALIETTQITQQRDITFNESSALAKEAEEVLLYRDMQNDIVQQMLRRLAAIKLQATP
jgi:LPS-assembly lipoprotein